MNTHNLAIIVAIALLLNTTLTYEATAQSLPGIIPAQVQNGNSQQNAIRTYNAIIAKKDGSIEAHIALATIYRKNGQAKDAVAIMKDAQSRKPDSEKVLAHLGYALIAANKPKEAVHIFDMLTAINHQSIAGYNGKAVAFDHAGNHIAAQEIYQQALHLSPDSSTIQNNLAVSMIMSGKPDSAIDILKPLSKKPNAPKTVYYNLALAYGVKGDGKRAHAINRKYMTEKQAADNQEFYDHYAYLLESQKLEEIQLETQEKEAQTNIKKKEKNDDIAVNNSAFKPEKIEKSITKENKEKSSFWNKKTSFWGSDVKAEYPR